MQLYYLKPHVYKQSDQMNCHIFQTIAPKIAMSRKAKISTTKLNLKTQNIYIKPVSKP